MPVAFLRPGEPFPDPRDADPSGLVAVGGDLEPNHVLSAYRQGIFPWYEEGMPVLWHCPDPRFVLPIARARVARSLRKSIRRHPYRIDVDRHFGQVVTACAKQKRPGQRGTWITREMHRAYVLLHEAGYAHSFEAYAANGDLVGGLYGVAINGIFCGESMFARADDASKIAFVYALAHLRSLGFTHVDCQVHTAHLERFGAQPWERNDFLDLLQAPAESPARIGLWNFDATIDILVEAFIADLSIDE